LKKTSLAILLIGLSLSAKSQIYKEGESTHLGIKFGLQGSTLKGTDLSNPAWKAGFQPGVFYRAGLGSGWHLETEFQASFKGARFKNTDSSGYELLPLLYFETPLLLMKSLDKEDKHLLLVGGQASYLVRSRVFVNNELTPRQENLALKTWDYSFIAGYQINSYYTGWQFALRYGLRNINNGLEFKGFGPPVKAGNGIRNLSFDVSMMF